MIGVERIEQLLARYPLRGIKGPMGTAQDMLDLLDGDESKRRSGGGSDAPILFLVAMACAARSVFHRAAGISLANDRAKRSTARFLSFQCASRRLPCNRRSVNRRFSISCVC